MSSLYQIYKLWDNIFISLYNYLKIGTNVETHI